MVHCMRTWHHYLLGSHFTIFTVNVVASYFATQKKLTSKQAKWQDFLTDLTSPSIINWGTRMWWRMPSTAKRQR